MKSQIAPNDRTKSGGTITHVHTWPSKWSLTLPHSFNTEVKKRSAFPLLNSFALHRLYNRFCLPYLEVITVSCCFQALPLSYWFITYFSCWNLWFRFRHHHSIGMFYKRKESQSKLTPVAWWVVRTTEIKYFWWLVQGCNLTYKKSLKKCVNLGFKPPKWAENK